MGIMAVQIESGCFSQAINSAAAAAQTFFVTVRGLEAGWAQFAIANPDFAARIRARVAARNRESDDVHNRNEAARAADDADPESWRRLARG